MISAAPSRVKRRRKRFQKENPRLTYQPPVLLPRSVLRTPGRAPAWIIRVTGGLSRSAAAPAGSGRITQCIQTVLVVRIHRGDIAPVCNHGSGRKHRRNFLRDFPRCGPLRPPLERNHETNATERINVVTESRMKHPSLAVAEREENRLIVTGSVILGVGISGREHGHVFAGSTQAVV